ncbi:MAG: hypothetical protein J0I15_07100 [Herbaspirillum huttiense]|uniref:hypothetical protein n=1 Tax=Herbaspirillum huttiense TaxID=863372 RepID=UPI001AD3EAAF|nr:hypothetical protein [Herbaspirillum huttiense]MBN9356196.1 hypothetical protein [Herbaspirillum huttiense]
MSHLHLIDWRAGVDTAKKTRPTVSRLRRRALRMAKRCATWTLYGASFVAGVILMLILIQEALHAPLTTMPTDTAVVAPASKAGSGV